MWMNFADPDAFVLPQTPSLPPPGFSNHLTSNSSEESNIGIWDDSRRSSGESDSSFGCTSQISDERNFQYTTIPSTIPINEKGLFSSSFNINSDILSNNQYQYDMLVKHMIKGLQNLNTEYAKQSDDNDRIDSPSIYVPDQSYDINKYPFYSETQNSRNVDSARFGNRQNFLEECINKNRHVAEQLSEKYLLLTEQINRCFYQIQECISRRKKKLLENLNTVYQLKIATLNVQMNKIRYAIEGIQNGSANVDHKIELYMKPADNDEINLNVDELWQLIRSVDRFGQISTNACSNLSYLCCEAADQNSHQRTCNCPPTPIRCCNTNKPFQLEVQTKNYLGALMNAGGDLVQASVINSNGDTYPATVLDCKSGRYIITTVFSTPGRYIMTISVNGKMIRDVPIQIYVHSSYSQPLPQVIKFSAQKKRTRKFTIQYKPGFEHVSFDNFKSSDGSTISEYSMFCRPWGVCCDPENNVYVADRSNNHIKILNINGNYVLILGSFGTAEGEFDRPSSATFDKQLGRLIVCDKDNHRIQIFKMDITAIKNKCLQEKNKTDYFIDLSVKPLFCFGNRGNRPGEFHYPWDCAVNSNSEILITDTRNHRIQMFTSKGLFLRKFGYDGILWKRFDSPRGITVSDKDMVIVSDFNNHKIVVMDPDLSNEHYFGGEGEEAGKFKRPQGVAFDNSGNILVTDSRNYRIQAFGMDGSFKYQFGCFGVGVGEEMDRPTGLCMATDGTLLVVDFGNNRLLAF